MPPELQGQTSTEWIALMAVILVIALLVVTLTNSMIKSTASISATRSKSYWGSQAAPLLITDWNIHPHPAPKNANLTLYIYNPTPNRIILKTIDLEPGYFNQAFYLTTLTSAGTASNLNPSSGITLAPGDKIGLIVQQLAADADSVEVSNSYELNLTMRYDMGMGAAQEVGLVPLAGKRS